MCIFLILHSSTPFRLRSEIYAFGRCTTGRTLRSSYQVLSSGVQHIPLATPTEEPVQTGTFGQFPWTGNVVERKMFQRKKCWSCAVFVDSDTLGMVGVRDAELSSSCARTGPRKRCRAAGVRPSMCSVGDCDNDALCESFFATLECERLDRITVRTPKGGADRRVRLHRRWYNPRPRDSALDYASPVVFEQLHAAARADSSTPEIRSIIPHDEAIL